MTEALDRQAEALLRLRVLVLALGESAHAKWWRSQFFTEAGLRFLERLYPRTYGAAAIRAATPAARNLHDASIGRGGVYHLFRLPEDLERQIHTLTGNGDAGKIVADVTPILADRASLLQRLETFATDPPASAMGPQRLGTSKDLRRPDVTATIAGAYLYAFRNNGRVFPYFVSERTS